MEPCDDSFEEISTLLAPILARVIDFGRGPVALMNWLATQPTELNLPTELAVLSRELARLLAEKLQSEALGPETQANTDDHTRRI